MQTPTPASEAGHNAVFVDDDSISRILDRDTNVLVVRRALSEHRVAAFRRATRSPWEKRITLDMEKLDNGIAALVESVADDEARAYLETEIEHWARRFSDLVEQRHLAASLASVATDMCRKFHTDWVGLRLLCTLLGPATEWIDDADVDRSCLGRLDLGLDDANRAILRPGARVQHTVPGDIILLKGDAWPGNEGRGAVHRSPPIEDLGEKRLLLKLDAADCGC